MMSPNLPTALKGLKSMSTTITRTVGALSSSPGQNQIPTKTQSEQFHGSARREYPQAAALPLPNNIDQTEIMRFSPQRHRDLCSNIIEAHQSVPGHGFPSTIDITVDNSTTKADAHIGPYDCTGSISLNASMQSNVPTPFSGTHKFSHLNMPGGQWGQGIRLMAGDQHDSHYTNLRRSVRQDWAAYDQTATVERLAADQKKGALLLLSGAAAGSGNRVGLMSVANASPLTRACFVSVWHGSSSCMKKASYSTKADDKPLPKKEEVSDAPGTEAAPAAPLSRAELLKKAFKEYGSTIVIFHVSISLISLGTFYMLVSSGLDVVAILKYIGLGETSLSGKLEAGATASTFVVAYAVHKLFSPVRISITLASAPFIVRFLRRKGFLKAAPAKSAATSSLPPKP